MKENEAPKSNFVYPDKLYARCKDNKTLDMSYAPQTLEAVEYTRTDAFIEKALDFFENDLCCYIKAKDFTIEHGRLEADFKKAMEL